MKNKISVTIVTRNRSEQLRRCLESLIKQSTTPFEVLVVDNASSDRTKETASAFSSSLPIKYFYEKRVGIPYARNRALKEARGTIIAFIDDDCEATSPWLTNMISAHKKHPGIAAIQGESVGRDLHNLFSLISHFFHKITIKANLVKKNTLLYLDTKNVSFKLGVIRKYRLQFDTHFLQGSDVDFAKQLLSRELKIVYYPRAKIFFGAREDLFSFLLQRFLWGKANAALEFKWPKQHFPSTRVKKKNKFSLLYHPLTRKYWYKLPLILLLHRLAKQTEKVGRFIAKIEIQYRKLGYGDNIFLHSRKSNFFKTISVAVITKNRPSQLKTCLKSLLNQTQKPDEVIIVDSSTNNKTSRIVDSFAKKLYLRLIHQEPLGRGVARNTALSQAKGDIVAFIDDDMKADSRWVEQMFIGHNRYQKYAAIEGRLLSLPEGLVWALVEQFRIDRWFIEKINTENSMDVHTTKNVSFKRELINRLKIRFIEHPNPAFAELIGEDTDFAKQLLMRRQKIRYLSSALAYHWERSSLFEFLKQQYRKGYSYGLNKKEWPQYYPDVRRKTFLSLIYSRFLLPPVQMILHPILQKHPFKFIFILPIYYLSVFVYFKGYLDALKNRAWQYQRLPTIAKTKTKLSHITVAIITRNRAEYLRRALYSLVNQSVLPSEVLIIDNGSIDVTKNTVESFKSYLPIRYVIEPKVGVSYARNKALEGTNSKIIAFLDDDCEASPNWLKFMCEAHEEYQDAAAIQGLAESVPKESIVSILTRFNRQTWIRDNMAGDRNLYWDMVRGKVKKGIPVLFCDTRNVSYKVPILRRFKVAFDENLTDKGDDYDFAKQLLHHKQTIMFYPMAKVYHYERCTLRAFLQQRFYQGRSSQYLFMKWPRKYFSTRKRRFIRKFAAFLYFSFVNSYFVELLALITLFWLSEGAYVFGKRSYPKQTK